MDSQKKPVFPPQHQNRQPGKEGEMNPAPKYDDPDYKPSGRLAGKAALITGGDGGIGRAVAVAFAKEGADVAIAHLWESGDAEQVKRDSEAIGARCICLEADLKQGAAAADIAERTAKAFGKIDVLVNNAGAQYPQNSILDITKDQLLHTFESNIFSFFYLTKAALPYMGAGSAIVNTASITVFDGSPTLIDYSATKGAIVAFTRSLSLSLVKQGIRVNAVAPGPVWTPLIPASASPQDVITFGSDTPMGRAGQPCELAPAYVFLACADSAYITGQILHINGGKIVN